MFRGLITWWRALSIHHIIKIKIYPGKQHFAILLLFQGVSLSFTITFFMPQGSTNHGPWTKLSQGCIACKLSIIFIFLNGFKKSKNNICDAWKLHKFKCQCSQIKFYWSTLCSSLYMLSMHAISVARSCLTLCDPMGYNLPGSSVHGVS